MNKKRGPSPVSLEGGDDLYGGDGNDKLVGDCNGLAIQYHGADYLEGGNGNDTLFGGAGNDQLLEGSAGSDNLTGGTGDDTYSFTASATLVIDRVIAGASYNFEERIAA